MSLLEVSLVLPIYGVKSPKKLYCLGLDRHFQIKLANCGSMAVCHLQLDRFLHIGDEMLSADGSVRPGTRDHGRQSCAVQMASVF